MWRASTSRTASVKIVFVGGFSRSGSTLLGRALGEGRGGVCLGETRYLWSRGLVNNVECGCGTVFRRCPFWSAVGEEAFGGWDRVDAERLSELDRVTNLPGALPVYQFPWLRPRLRRAIDDYSAFLAALYPAIARVSGARVIVEMSRDPTFARLLMRIPESDVRIVHLVRDSRAVAYSWTRQSRLPSPIGEQEFMPQFGLTETARSWMVRNGAIHALAALRSPFLRVTYESFVDAPADVLQRISSWADESLGPAPSELSGATMMLGDHHIFSGNPMRSAVGWVPLRVDNEWQTQLSAAQIAKVTGITWPLLAAYGYPLLSGVSKPEMRTGASG
jgi:hypothetical protein